MITAKFKDGDSFKEESLFIPFDETRLALWKERIDDLVSLEASDKELIMVQNIIKTMYHKIFWNLILSNSLTGERAKNILKQL